EATALDGPLARIPPDGSERRSGAGCATRPVDADLTAGRAHAPGETGGGVRPTAPFTGRHAGSPSAPQTVSRLQLKRVAGRRGSQDDDAAGDLGLTAAGMALDAPVPVPVEDGGVHVVAVRLGRRRGVGRRRGTVRIDAGRAGVAELAGEAERLAVDLRHPRGA